MRCDPSAHGRLVLRRRGTSEVSGLLIAAGACLSVLGPATPASAGGDAEAGRVLFTDKACARCHVPGGVTGGPALERLRRPQGQMELAGRLWNHVPEMFAAMTIESAAWPRISAEEMSDLMAYLLADAARDPQPDIARGEVLVIRKSCLKCHSLAREGGRIEPDLAERRADYESAVAWATAMWTHTPAMAAMAARQGVSYPRFSGDEMAHLVGYLKQAAASPRRPAAR